MATTWTFDELQRIGSSDELHIAAQRADGTLGRWVPIWVVCVGEQVYVRTWHRRDTGWFGHVLASGRAHVRVPGLAADVVVADIGEGAPAVRAGIDAAYRAKYSHYGSSSLDAMTTPAAAATTLQLSAEQQT